MLVEQSFWIESSNEIFSSLKKDTKLRKYLNMLFLWIGNTWYMKSPEIEITQQTFLNN